MKQLQLLQRITDLLTPKSFNELSPQQWSYLLCNIILEIPSLLVQSK